MAEMWVHKKREINKDSDNKLKTNGKSDNSGPTIGTPFVLKNQLILTKNDIVSLKPDSFNQKSINSRRFRSHIRVHSKWKINEQSDNYPVIF